MQSGRFQRNENVNSNTKMECIQWARVPHCTLLWALHNSTAATAVPSWILLHCVGYYTAHSALCYCLLQHIALSHRFVTHCSALTRFADIKISDAPNQLKSTQLKKGQHPLFNRHKRLYSWVLRIHTAHRCSGVGICLCLRRIWDVHHEFERWLRLLNALLHWITNSVTLA